MSRIAPPTVAELIAALPDDEETSHHSSFEERCRSASRHAIPTGFSRFGATTSLSLKIGLGYFAYWAKSWFQDADAKHADLLQTNLKSAVRMLESMTYLRGAIMKTGQTLANFRDFAPDEVVDTLESLHFKAPPLHYSLVKAYLTDELGGCPDEVFASFERHAFAAASIGQVHRAQLATGEAVAVKVQYPSLARSIAEDMRNLSLLLFPMRLSRDYQNAKAQVDHIRESLEREVDYNTEADFQKRARSLFTSEDKIEVPRVYSKYSTQRVLCSEYLDGIHLSEFLQNEPAQDLRDAFGEKIIRALFRMFYSGRVCYGDIHSGNFLFMPDGRLAILDFGYCLQMDDEEWAWMGNQHRAMATGRSKDIRDHIGRWTNTDDCRENRERFELCEQFVRWARKPFWHEGAFDFADEVEYTRGVKLWMEMASKRYTRAQPSTFFFNRFEFGYWTLLYKLRARVNVRKVVGQEYDRAGRPFEGAS